MARRAARPLLTELAVVIRDIATALQHADEDEVEDAIVRARGLDTLVDRFAEAAAAGNDAALWAPLRRRQRSAHARYGAAASALDLAVRDVRVLARGAAGGRPRGPRAAGDIQRAGRTRRCGRRAGAVARRPRCAERARAHALRAAGEATLGLERTANLSASHIVAQVRATSYDLLRSLGVEGEDARAAVREAAREAATR